MIDKLNYIEVDGKKYPMAFSLNVMERVQEEYGSMQAWSETLQPSSGEPKIKDVIWTFKELINEGIEIENEKSGGDRQPITHKQAGRLITNIKEVTEKMTEIVTKSLKTENPNAQTTQSQTNQ